MAQPTLAGKHNDGSSGITYVQVIVDTDALLRSPSAENAAEASQTIVDAKGGVYVNVTNGRWDRATSDVTIDAAEGNRIRVFAKSGSNNFEDVALITGLVQNDGDAILKDFQIDTEKRMEVLPASTADVLPAHFGPQQFSFCESTVLACGVASYRLVFATYLRDMGGRPRLAGRWQWPFRIQVRFASA